MRLKALVFGLVLGVLTVSQASAQKFNLGLEAGTNFANFIGSDVSNNSLNGSRLGLVGGAFLALNFGDSFAIRPEILYSQKGGKDTSNNTYQMDYVEVPVLLKLSLGTPVVNPGILAGPSFSWNTVAQVADSGGNSSSIQNVNTSDIGFIVGAEVDIDKFFVTGRYEMGFNNIVTAIPGSSGGANVQNGIITAMIGYSFL
jgi:hypothetical protein